MNPPKKIPLVTGKAGRQRLNWSPDFDLLSRPGRKRVWSRPGPASGLAATNPGNWWKNL